MDSEQVEYITRTLTMEAIGIIDYNLSMMEYGEIIITKHQDKLTIDIKNRDRKYIKKIDN